ncbi:MAG: DUF6273 domain-containing protein, partial [Lachnospiraceae bacterium]|nr:DUF6273 domain-containing protein [Lachnospiraceae bacterium]
FTVITPNTNMAIRGTVVAVKTIPQKDGSCKTINYVLEGSVEVTLANNKKITLKAGEGWETTTNKKGKVTESKKTDASDLDFKDIDVKQLKGADGAEIIINKGGSGSNGNNDNSRNGDSSNNNGSGNGESNNGSDTEEVGYYNGKVKKGGIIKLGKYEQDNNTGNGTEDIEWIVLSVEDDKAFILSKYALDCQMYNTVNEEIRWENCTLRTWLNDDFYNAAFSKSEQDMIRTTTIETYDSEPLYRGEAYETKDKIFLLSEDDICNTAYGFNSDYSDTDVNRRCAPTEYAAEMGAFPYSGTDASDQTADGKDPCYWWLRSRGLSADHAERVTYKGDVDTLGRAVNYDSIGVRPALWINLKP